MPPFAKYIYISKNVLSFFLSLAFTRRDSEGQMALRSSCGFVMGGGRVQPGWGPESLVLCLTWLGGVKCSHIAGVCSKSQASGEHWALSGVLTVDVTIHTQDSLLHLPGLLNVPFLQTVWVRSRDCLLPQEPTRSDRVSTRDTRFRIDHMFLSWRNIGSLLASEAIWQAPPEVVGRSFSERRRTWAPPTTVKGKAAHPHGHPHFSSPPTVMSAKSRRKVPMRKN